MKMSYFLEDGSSSVFTSSFTPTYADNNHSDGIDIYLFPENNSNTLLL